jgi:hypothetical protein
VAAGSGARARSRKRARSDNRDATRHLLPQLPQQLAPHVRQHPLHLRQPRQRIGERAQVAGVGGAGGGAAHEALEVVDEFQLGAEAVGLAAASEELRDGVEAAVDGRGQQERLQKPVAQEAAAHRRQRFVDQPQEAAAGAVVAQGADQLQIAAGGGVDDHEFGAAVGGQALQVREGVEVVLADVA